MWRQRHTFELARRLRLAVVIGGKQTAPQTNQEGIMRGFGYTVQKLEGRLIISIDLAGPPRLSNSHKAQLFASSQGGADIGDGLTLGLNLYKSLPSENWDGKARAVAALAKAERYQRDMAKMGVKVDIPEGLRRAVEAYDDAMLEAGETV